MIAVVITSGLAVFLVGVVFGGWIVQDDYRRAERIRIAEIRAKQAYIRDLKDQYRELNRQRRQRGGV